MSIEVKLHCFTCDKSFSINEMPYAIRQVKDAKHEFYFLSLIDFSTQEDIVLGLQLFSPFDFLCSGSCLGNYLQKKSQTI